MLTRFGQGELPECYGPDDSRCYQGPHQGILALLLRTLIALLQKDMQLEDWQTGVPATVFLLAFLATVPFYAKLSDAGFSRVRILAGGMVLWSAAASAAYFAPEYYSFLFTRML